MGRTNMDERLSTRRTLDAFLKTLSESVERNVRELGRPVATLSLEETKRLYQRLTYYAGVELLQEEALYSLPIVATGTGMMMVIDSDNSGGILDTEIVSDGDIVTGAIDDVMAYSVPTLACIRATGQSEDIPYHSQVMSPMLVLSNARYKTGKKVDGGFRAEHNLSGFHVALALAHDLKFTLDGE